MNTRYPWTRWLITNLVLLSASFFLPWIYIGFEPVPRSSPVSGWDLTVLRITASTELMLQYGFGWLWISSLLEGLGSIVVLGYIIFSIFRIAQHKVFQGNIMFLCIFVAVIFNIILRTLLYSEINFPLPGYWLYCLGLISSAILESKANIATRSQART